MKPFAIVSIILLLTTSTVVAFAQQPQLASYREVARILVDEKLMNQTTASITLASTSPVEMRVPAQLNQEIQNATNVTSVVITNENKCILGIQDQACVIVNVVSPSLIGTYNITKIQSSAQKIGDTLIGDINKAFAINAQINSVYVNPTGALSNALGTSGAVAGNRTISVVYTMSKPDSSYLFDGLTSILIPKPIRDDGGFFDAAKNMTQDSNSTVTFAIIPGQSASIYQLTVAKHFPIKNKITTIRPLDLIGIAKLQRSSYYSVGFFPLNSIFQVVAISNDNLAIANHGGTLVPTTINNGHKIPSDLTKAGWVFDPESGQEVNAVYLFGTTTSATNDDLYLTLGNSSTTGPAENTTNNVTLNPKSSSDYSTYVLVGIAIAGGAAIYIFIRRR